MKILFLLIISITTVFFIGCDDGNDGSTDKTACDGITCGDNGSCEVIDNNASCKCDTGYHADDLNCIKNDEIDPCKDITCGDNGSCEVIDNNASCKCDIGYHADNLNCVDTNECTEGSHNCNQNNHCVNTEGSFTCECDTDFHDEKGACIPNTKTVSCKVVSPPNAETLVVDTSINWTETDNWEEPDACVWTCKDGFISEDEYCVVDFTTVEKNIIVEMPFSDFTQYHISGSEDITLDNNGEATVSVFPVFRSVYLLDSNDDIVAIYKANLETEGDILITTDTTAMGIIMSAPIDWKVYQESFTDIKQQIKAHASFELMKERIYTIANNTPSLLLKDNYLIELAKEVLTDVRLNLTLNTPPPSWLVSPVVTADTGNNGIDKCNMEITNKRAIPYGISVLNLDDDDIYSGWGSERFFWISGKSTFRYLTGFLPEDKTDPFYNNSIVKNMGFEGGNVTGTYKLNKAGHYYVCIGKFPFSAPDAIGTAFQELDKEYISYSDAIFNLDVYMDTVTDSLNLNRYYARLKGGAGIIPDIILMVLGISSSNPNNSEPLSDAVKADVKDFIKAMYDVGGNESNFKTSLDDLVNLKTLFTVGKSNTVKWALKYLANKGLTHFIGKAAGTGFKAFLKSAGIFISLGQLGVMMVDSTAADAGKCYNVIVDDSCNMNISEVTQNCSEMQCNEPTSCHSGVCVLDDGRCIDDSACNTNNGEYCKLDTYTCAVDPCYGLNYDNTYQHCENGVILTNEGLCSSNTDCEADETCSNSHFCVKNIVSSCENVTCGYKGRCYIEDSEAKCYCYRGYQDNNNNLECSPSCFADTCTGEHMTGVCDDSSGVAICECDAGYDGVNCDNDIDECAGNPCLNGGTCTDGINSYSCECADGYSGDNCEVVEIVEDCGADGMCTIPAGTFLMGCNEAADDREKPQHQVTLSAYKMDKYEVTVAQFKQCVTAGACSSDNFSTTSGSHNNYNVTGRDNHPMNFVSWNGAKEYCAWAGKRLPTEAEWEYAARGANLTKYPWGNESPSCDKAVYYGCNNGHTSEVGSRPSGKSPFGLYDMAGNVWEWVEDCYKNYTSEAVSNPLNNSCDTDASRVLRGGGWNFESNGLRSSYRCISRPSDMIKSYGFRCAKSQ